MPEQEASLLPGRNIAPLEQRKIDAAINTFYGLDRSANVRYEEGARTVFRVTIVDDNEVCEIVVGPDIYPGSNIVDPNSSLGMKCAVAHELMHKSRHEDSTEIDEPELEHLDEALTSLGAILRFQNELNDHEVRQLVSDACHRLQKYIAGWRENQNSA
jgi:hypothetical protein